MFWILSSALTNTVNGRTVILAVASYPVPAFVTVAEVICPKLLILDSKVASAPSPLIVKVGATLYPLPALVILTLDILPLVITGVSIAGVILFVLIKVSSAKVSIVRSYSLEIVVGAVSFLFSDEILN